MCESGYNSKVVTANIDTSVISVHNLQLLLRLPVRMKLLIRDDAASVTEWAAKYVIKRINVRLLPSLPCCQAFR